MRRIRSGWLTYPTSSQTVPSRSMMIARRPIALLPWAEGRSLARRARLPSTVHPQPLLGIASDVALDDRRARRREAEHVGGAIVARPRVERRLDAHGDCT